MLGKVLEMLGWLYFVGLENNGSVRVRAWGVYGRVRCYQSNGGWGYTKEMDRCLEFIACKSTWKVRFWLVYSRKLCASRYELCTYGWHCFSISYLADLVLT